MSAFIRCDEPMLQIRRANFRHPKRRSDRGAALNNGSAAHRSGDSMADGTTPQGRTSVVVEPRCAWCREHPGVEIPGGCIGCSSARDFASVVQGEPYYMDVTEADEALISALSTLPVEELTDPMSWAAVDDPFEMWREYCAAGIDPDERSRADRRADDEDARDAVDDDRAAAWEVRS